MAANQGSQTRPDPNHLSRWPILTNEQILLNTPSQADGWTPAQEITVRKKAARVIFDTAKAHGVSAGTSAVAVTMFLRFYCRRSMAKNHPFVMALASLFLACKANDNPRALRGLQVEMLKQWYGRDSPELRERLNEVDKMKKLRDTAVHAESMLLMMLDFDLNIDVLLFIIVKAIREIPELRGFKDAKVQQKLVNVCNDIMRNDGTFVLVYPYEKLAVAICHFFCQKDKTLTVPPKNPDGTHWYERFGLTVQEMDMISERLIKMYKKINKEKSKTTTTNSSGGFAASVRERDQMRGQGVPQPTGSRVGSKSPRSGSPAETNANMHPSATVSIGGALKRPKSEPEVGTESALNEAFRSQVDGEKYDGYHAQYVVLDVGSGTRRTQGVQVDYGDLPFSAGRRHPAPPPNQPPSSPEEGEIEEGEIA